MDEELLADFDSFTAPQEEVPTEAPIAETQPIETVSKPSLTEPAIVPEENQMLSDFDTFTQPQIDPVEQHRPPEVDDFSWEDIKGRVSKFLTDYTPIMAVPQMVTGFAAEVAQKEGSQIAEAQSVKARIENIEFAYSDLSDAIKSATGDKEAEESIKVKRNALNDEVVSILEILMKMCLMMF